MPKRVAVHIAAKGRGCDVGFAYIAVERWMYEGSRVRRFLVESLHDDDRIRGVLNGKGRRLCCEDGEVRWMC